MSSIVGNLLHKPFAILVVPLYHSILELLFLVSQNFLYIFKFVLTGLVLFAGAASLGYYQRSLWCLKWVGLGVLSSIGFGFGMHTFVLFLAPFIASVTMAGQSCQSLNFPEPPFPKEIICPENVPGNNLSEVTFTAVLQKVSLESFMWGLGTALGELPPYLAARLRAQAIRRKFTPSGDSHGRAVEPADDPAGWELAMIKVIKKIGFVGILLCAAIPNPLFDAAGVASGVAQVPFATFFGATFIGKAIIKVLLQSSFVIFLFYKNNLDTLIREFNRKLVELFPSLNDLNLHSSLAQFLEEQRTNVLKKSLNEPNQPSLISTLFNWLICAMMLLFILSVINALDKRYRERKDAARKAPFKKD